MVNILKNTLTNCLNKLSTVIVTIGHCLCHFELFEPSLFISMLWRERTQNNHRSRSSKYSLWRSVQSVNQSLFLSYPDSQVMKKGWAGGSRIRKVVRSGTLLTLLKLLLKTWSQNPLTKNIKLLWSVPWARKLRKSMVYVEQCLTNIFICIHIWEYQFRYWNSLSSQI